ncbi:MAG: P1 family peptidase [Deltaproteobacteria bacterium]|nr:P1 family peptidase [Deltaproteobacteria bacterium]
MIGQNRKRLRELGIVIGQFEPGPHDSITDVPGVRVGHVTLVHGEGPLIPGKGPVRTGVTAIRPRENTFIERVVGGAYVLNGAGEVSGMTQLDEWGLLETPILLTNTLSLGRVSSAAAAWMIQRYPDIGVSSDVIIPVVGECDDSWLNDSAGQHVDTHHVFDAIESAHSGPVAEGAVGGGTGMVCFDFKAGIGSASRVVTIGKSSFTVGVLTMTNFGAMRHLRLDGLRLGELLEPEFDGFNRRRVSQGSIIVVLATDAPMMALQVRRLCKRAALGVGRAGSHAEPGSGEIIIGFSTANTVPRVADPDAIYKLDVLLDSSMGPFYAATIEATEEAIMNSLTMAEEMTGLDGHLAPALPLDRLVDLYDRHLWGRRRS